MDPADHTHPTPAADIYAERPEASSRSGAASSLGGSERRQFERTGLSRRGTLAELDSDGHPGLEVACETANISRGGLGVRCKRMIAPGRMVRVRITGPTGAPAVLFGVVRACRYDGEGVHLVGIQFQLTAKGNSGTAA